MSTMRAAAPDCVRDLLAAVPVADEWKAKLHALMSGDDRFYHGIDHLALLFDRHLRFAREAGLDGLGETRRIACAIAFHDCVYDSSRGDNEERSAQVWLEASAAGKFDADERTWVADTIRATADHLGYAGPIAAPGSLEALRLWMLDLDLTPFGEAPDVFDYNARLLRAEAPKVSGEAFETARLRLLRRFADAPVIFRTAAIADRFDAPARGNIARHLTAADARAGQ